MYENAKHLYEALTDFGLPRTDYTISANNSMLIPFKDCPFQIKINTCSYTIVPDGTLVNFDFDETGQIKPSKSVVMFRSMSRLIDYVMHTFTYVQNVKEVHERDQHDLDVLVNQRLREIMDAPDTLVLSLKHKQRRANYLDYISRQLGATRFLSSAIEYSEKGEIKTQRVTKSVSDSARADFELSKKYQQRRPDWRGCDHIYKEPLGDV